MSKSLVKIKSLKKGKKFKLPVTGRKGTVKRQNKLSTRVEWEPTKITFVAKSFGKDDKVVMISKKEAVDISMETEVEV